MSDEQSEKSKAPLPPGTKTPLPKNAASALIDHGKKGGAFDSADWASKLQAKPKAGDKKPE